MQAPTGYHEKLIELSSDLVNHGFGNATIEITTLKDATVKIDILCGKRYIFFIKKEIRFDNEHLL